MTIVLRKAIILITFFFFSNALSSAASLDHASPWKKPFALDDSIAIDRLRMSCLFGEEREAANNKPSQSDNGFFDYERLHRYLGYGTVLLAGVAAVSSSNKDVHYGAAYGCAGAALATVTTGYMAYSDRFNMEDEFFTKDNTHILLGTIGAIGCITAVALADSEGGNGHSGAGVFGGSAMALSVLTIRW